MSRNHSSCVCYMSTQNTYPLKPFIPILYIYIQHSPMLCIYNKPHNSKTFHNLANDPNFFSSQLFFYNITVFKTKNNFLEESSHRKFRV